MKARGMGAAKRGGNFNMGKAKKQTTGPVFMKKGGCVTKKYRKGGMAKKGCGKP